MTNFRIGLSDPNFQIQHQDFPAATHAESM
jgi:hypothetical protein